MSAVASGNAVSAGALGAQTDLRFECIDLTDIIPEFRGMPQINMTNKTLRIVLQLN